MSSLVPLFVKIKFYEVGGALRDELLGRKSKDIDYAVEGVNTFDELVETLKDLKFHIFQAKPQYYTVRAMVPKDHVLKARTDVADFVMCRKDGPSSDGRRPDSVEPGTIYDDLARRDFTVNAMAKDPYSNKILDPHGGIKDLEKNILNFVGNPMERIAEDGLRVLRGYRFIVTLGLCPSSETYKALRSSLAIQMLGKVSVDRMREELTKMFDHDVNKSIELVSSMPMAVRTQIFRDGLRLIPTQQKAA